MSAGAAFLLFVAAVTGGQGTASQRGSGVIHGVIKIRFGGGFRSGIQVYATSGLTPLARRTVTDEFGNYSLERLTPAGYVISAKAPEFAADDQVIEVHANSSSQVDLEVIDRNYISEVGPGVSAEPTPVEIAASELKARQTHALQLVELMWGITMKPERSAPASNPARPAYLNPRTVLEQLRQLGREAISPLILALEDPDVLMRQNGTIVLLDLAQADNPNAYAKIDIRSALPNLIHSLEDSDVIVRTWAAQGIGAIGSDAKSAVPALIKLLKDRNVESRKSSCTALGRIGPSAKAAIPALKQALKDRSIEVRQFADRAIKNIQN